jgi:hypothetical protein
MNTAQGTRRDYVNVRRALIGICAIVMIVAGIAVAFLVTGHGGAVNDWVGAGLIAGGVGLALDALIV